MSGARAPTDPMREIEFREVVNRWVGADSKNTTGILEAVQGLVERWTGERITAADVNDLRFIGAMPTDRWPRITGGTYRVGDAVDEAIETFAWRADWALITVRDPENGQRVILDGNNRALQLRLAVAAGRIRPDTPITVVTGDLFQGVRFIAKAVAPLWR